jgi:hypothetical protein
LARRPAMTITAQEHLEALTDQAQMAVNGGLKLLIFVRRAAHVSYHLKAESGTSTRHV